MTVPSAMTPIRTNPALRIGGFYTLATPLPPQDSGTRIDLDAYAVYSALIPSDWLLRVAHASELLIQNTTEVDSRVLGRCLPSGRAVTGPWLEALNDFEAQHTTAKSLDRKFSLPVPYRFESRDSIQPFFIARGPDDWRNVRLNANNCMWMS